MILKKYCLAYIFVLLSLISCEISDISPENYWPKPGDRLDTVENFWGAPNDRDSYYDGDLFVITYYYYDEGVYIDFIDDVVDLVGTLE